MEVSGEVGCWQSQLTTIMECRLFSFMAVFEILVFQVYLLIPCMSLLIANVKPSLASHSTILDCLKITQPLHNLAIQGHSFDMSLFQIYLISPQRGNTIRGFHNYTDDKTCHCPTELPAADTSTARSIRKLCPLRQFEWKFAWPTVTGLVVTGASHIARRAPYVAEGHKPSAGARKKGA